MGNLLFKTAIKWALIAFGVQLLMSLPAIFFSDSLLSGNQSMRFVSVAMGFVSILFHVIIYVAACLEFSKKRNHLSNTGEMFSLVGLTFGILTVFSLSWMLIYQNYLIELPNGVSEYMDDEQFKRSMIIGGLISTFGIGLVAALMGITIAGIWRTFQKAGKPGWASIVPIYHQVVLCEIGKKPTWWVIMLFLPVLNIIFSIMILSGVSNAFGKSTGWTVGLIFLPFIFYPLLAWSGAIYLYDDPEDDRPSGKMGVEEHLVE